MNTQTRRMCLAGFKRGVRGSHPPGARAPESLPPKGEENYIRGMAELHDDVARRRLEMVEAGQVVFADYRRDGARLYIDHVEAPVALRGTGAAGRFMEKLARDARAEGLTLVPICSYAAHWLRRHPEAARGVV